MLLFRSKLGLYLSLVVLSFVAQAQQKQPNILFCIADDWGKHAGVYGDKVIHVPTFDHIAQGGVLFTNAYCGSPSCTPSRATVLTGRYPHQNEESGNLWSTLQTKLPNFAMLLAQEGYHVGLQGKGWGPGDFTVGGYEHNPAGKNYKNFDAFLAKRTDKQPFFFWFGSNDPHRPYQKGTGKAVGMNPDEVKVPKDFPDTPEVRNDILDYYYEVQRFDREVGELIKKLESIGELENTLIVITSDNGMPFPRAKANLYDAGTNLPLAIYWKGHIQPQRTGTFMSFADFAPTFLETASLAVPKEMTGKSLWPLLNQTTKVHRNEVFLERERHAAVRPDNHSYPMRAVRTKDFLYIQNLEHDRWPAGDPFGQSAPRRYGDVDDGPTKSVILGDTLQYASHYQLAFAKRPAEELYDLRKDPNQHLNVATQKAYQKVKKQLEAQLTTWRKNTQDPRAEGKVPFETYPYYGNGSAKK
ncbi:MAG: sulfatase [Spirosomataceae bacterium]